jgi:transcriptional regulator with XRE-family HTH domain
MRKRKEIDAKTWKLVKKIAKNIKAIRKSKGLTQEDMDDLGFGPRWFQRLESGTHIPTIPTLDKLARVFKIEITDFFE